MGNVHLPLIYGLLFLSALTMYLPIVPTPLTLTAADIGYLRRGRRGAVLTALAVLHADGLIAVRQRGGVRRTQRPRPSGRDAFEGTVYGALHTPGGPRSLAHKPGVRRALDTMSKRLAGAGLVAGRLRLVVGKTLLIAVPVIAVLRVAAGNTGSWTVLAVAAGVLIAVCLWLLSRATIAGHLLLRRLRRRRALLLLRVGEDTTHDPSVAPATRDDTKTFGRLLAPHLAMGLGINAAAFGLHPLDAFITSEADFAGIDIDFSVFDVDSGAFDGSDSGPADGTHSLP